MPLYNLVCPSCGHDKDEFTSYETFCEHNTSETAIVCPTCANTTAFYSLSHLKQNFDCKDQVNVSNFYESCNQEKWLRGFGDLGKR